MLKILVALLPHSGQTRQLDHRFGFIKTPHLYPPKDEPETL
jgi:hypothetical protein